MRPEYRYALTGIAIGMLIFLLLAAGAFLWMNTPAGSRTPLPRAGTPAHTDVPATPTAVLSGFLPRIYTPVGGAAQTAAPLPAPAYPTITPAVLEEMLSNGALTFSGPLPEERQVLLYQVSLHYIALTSQAGIPIGEQINGPGYGDPSLLCGPLAFAILRDAGLIGFDLQPHDFWLLDPYTPTGRELLERAFPEEFFENLDVTKPVNQADWLAAPLQPGDFLYIRHGSGGNFDHMLVVNRVDSAGRAYTVTNYNTPQGFVINEALLYDPADPGAGLFHTWTSRPNALLGATGFGGFELWRLKAR